MAEPLAAAQSTPLESIQIAPPLTRPDKAVVVEVMLVTPELPTSKLIVPPTALRVTAPRVSAIAPVNLMVFAFAETDTAPKLWAEVPLISSVPPLPNVPLATPSCRAWPAVHTVLPSAAASRRKVPA